MRLTAKEYLQQIQELDDVVKNKMVELYQLECLATSVTAGGETVKIKDEMHCVERVQTSGISDLVGNTAAKIADLKAEIEENIAEYLDQKNQCIKIIEKVRLHHQHQYQVLFKHYVQYMPLVLVAKEIGLSYAYVLEIHKAALINVENILSEN